MFSFERISRETVETLRSSRTKRQGGRVFADDAHFGNLIRESTWRFRRAVAAACSSRYSRVISFRGHFHNLCGMDSRRRGYIPGALRDTFGKLTETARPDSALGYKYLPIGRKVVFASRLRSLGARAKASARRRLTFPRTLDPTRGARDRITRPLITAIYILIESDMRL